MREEWLRGRSRGFHLQRVGYNAANIACLFGLGGHGVYCNRAAGLWEANVYRDGTATCYYKKQSFNLALRITSAIYKGVID